MPRLHDFIRLSNDIEGLRELLMEDDPNDQDNEHYTALHVAVIKLHSHPDQIDAILLVARELIHHGADVNKVDPYQRTPLHYAVMLRNCKMIELLLQYKADVNKQEHWEEAPLHCAVTRHVFARRQYPIDESVVALLLKYGAYVDVQDMHQRSPLILATLAREPYVVERLLRKKADVTLQDEWERTAMHYALYGENVNFKIVVDLFRRELSFLTVDEDGDTPIDFIFAPNGILRTEEETGKNILKLYLFQRKHNKDEKMKRIIRVLKRLRPRLSRFLDLCARELKLMWHEKLTPDVYVYQIALRGAFYSFRSQEPHFSVEVYDQMLEKLLEGQYPIYSDLIVAGICSPYMMQKLYEESDISIALTDSTSDGERFDILCKMCSFMSHFDILNAIKARRLERNVPPQPQYISRFSFNIRCSVS